MKTILKIFLISASLLLFGCTSTNCRSNENYLFFENDTLRVVYMFWGENGVMGLFIHNKTEYPLYIDWKKCSFVTGTTKNDYWDESITILSSGNISSYGNAQTKATIFSDYWFNNFLSGYVRGTGEKTSKSNSQWFQQTFSNSLTRINKPERITFIPPHTTISQAAYNIVLGGITLFPSYPVISRDTILYLPPTKVIKEYRKTRLPMLNTTFDANNSPINFRSFITYSTDEKFSTEKYLDSKFYVSHVLELPEPAFNCQPDITHVSQNENNMWASPNRFYIFTKKGLKKFNDD